MDQYMVSLVGSKNLFPADLRKKMAKSELFSESFMGYRNGNPVPDGLSDVLFCMHEGRPGFVLQGDEGLAHMETPGFMLKLNRFIKNEGLGSGFLIDDRTLSASRSVFPVIYKAKSVVIAKTIEKQLAFKEMSDEQKFVYLESMISRDVEAYASRYGLEIVDELNVMVDPSAVEQKLSYYKHKKTNTGHTSATIIRDLAFSLDVNLLGYWAVGRLRSLGNGGVSHVY